MKERSFFLQKPEIHRDGEIGRSLMISWFGEALLVTSLQQSSFSSSCHHQCHHQCHHPANNVLVIKYFVQRRISVAQLAYQPISPSWGWAGKNIYQSSSISFIMMSMIINILIIISSSRASLLITIIVIWLLHLRHYLTKTLVVNCNAFPNKNENP